MELSMPFTVWQHESACGVGSRGFWPKIHDREQGQQVVAHVNEGVVAFLVMSVERETDDVLKAGGQEAAVDIRLARAYHRASEHLHQPLLP
jgi:hypothetical protein